MHKRTNKFCVFCGEVPKDKNKEHILPQWLLKLTGNPKRVVKFGFDYFNDRSLEFDWKSLAVPSCSACNSEFFL